MVLHIHYEIKNKKQTKRGFSFPPAWMFLCVLFYGGFVCFLMVFLDVLGVFYWNPQKVMAFSTQPAALPTSPARPRNPTEFTMARLRKVRTWLGLRQRNRQNPSETCWLEDAVIFGISLDLQESCHHCSPEASNGILFNQKVDKWFNLYQLGVWVRSKRSLDTSIWLSVSHRATRHIESVPIDRNGLYRYHKRVIKQWGCQSTWTLYPLGW